jgi:hypothetical protein
MSRLEAAWGGVGWAGDGRSVSIVEAGDGLDWEGAVDYLQSDQVGPVSASSRKALEAHNAAQAGGYCDIEFRVERGHRQFCRRLVGVSPPELRGAVRV